ncbi:MAG: hypothetical protein Q9161_003473 [Pseudevernia consocians]
MILPALLLSACLISFDFLLQRMRFRPPEEVFSNHTINHTPNQSGDNEAAARKNALEMGLQLADCSAVAQGTGVDVGNAQEGEKVEVKAEEDSDAD